MKTIYLACPYSYNPNESFEMANKVAAKLMQQGHIVFSPVSHSHKIADHMENEMRYSQNFWLKQDLKFMDVCDKLIIISIGKDGKKLIKESKGCQSEIQKAMKLNLPINYYKYEEK